MKQDELDRLQRIIDELKEAITQFKSRKDKSLIKEIIRELEFDLGVEKVKKELVGEQE